MLPCSLMHCALQSDKLIAVCSPASQLSRWCSCVQPHHALPCYLSSPILFGCFGYCSGRAVVFVCLASQDMCELRVESKHTCLSGSARLLQPLAHVTLVCALLFLLLCLQALGMPDCKRCSWWRDVLRAVISAFITAFSRHSQWRASRCFGMCLQFILY